MSPSGDSDDLALLRRSERTKLTAFLDALRAKGRRVVSVRVLSGDDHVEQTRRYDAARLALMRNRGLASRAQAALYHTTSCTAAHRIERSGFDLSFSGAHGGAFGRGVNLASTTDQALIYTFQRKRACTLLCRAAVGRRHANTSHAAPGASPGAPTIPRYVKPRTGFDSMIGMGGLIVVVPEPVRVLPVVVVTHEATR
jgi:hypothetical protein